MQQRFHLHNTIICNKERVFKVNKILCCIIAVLSILFFTQTVQAGVVKSSGVPRVVDGPQGEVVVTSVLDDTGVPANKYQDNSSAPVPTKPKVKATPKEPDVNDIEYKSSNLNPEETVPQPDNSYTKLIVIALLVLVVGLAIVFAMNKKK